MDYPAKFTVDTPAKVANWRILVQSILIIPHQIVFILMALFGVLLWLIAWVVAIFTAKIPAGIARYFVALSRYNLRIFSYILVLADVYPPFQWNGDDTDPGDHLARTDINVQLAGHNRLTVLFRPLLMIPAFVFFAVVQIIRFLIEIVMVFELLFTGRWPPAMYRYVVGAFNVELRLGAYAYLLTDRYPPFKLNLDAPDSMPAPMPAPMPASTT